VDDHKQSEWKLIDWICLHCVLHRLMKMMEMRRQAERQMPRNLLRCTNLPSWHLYITVSGYILIPSVLNNYCWMIII